MSDKVDLKMVAEILLSGLRFPSVEAARRLLEQLGDEAPIRSRFVGAALLSLLCFIERGQHLKPRPAV